jgi:hypothetical protein
MRSSSCSRPWARWPCCCAATSIMPAPGSTYLVNVRSSPKDWCSPVGSSGLITRRPRRRSTTLGIFGIGSTLVRQCSLIASVDVSLIDFRPAGSRVIHQTNSPSCANGNANRDFWHSLGQAASRQGPVGVAPRFRAPAGEQGNEHSVVGCDAWVCRGREVERAELALPLSIAVH